MKKPLTWLLVLIGISALIYLVVNRKSIFGTTTSNTTASNPPTRPASAPTSQILTRIEKNESTKKLSWIQYRSDSGQIVGSRELSFGEAVNATGGDSARVCQGPPKGYGATGYEECSRIRR